MTEILQPSWRGTQLQLRKDSSGKYMIMKGPRSLLYIPVDVLPNATYRITLELKNLSGNGKAYCNIFGSRKFDFTHKNITCGGTGWNTYDIDVETKEFPKTVPLVFRIWRNPDGTGELCVRRIIVSIIKGEETTPDEQTLIAEEPTATPTTVVKPKTPREVDPPDRRKQRREIERTKARERANARRKTRMRNVPNTDFIHHPKEPKVLPIIEGEDGIRLSAVVSVFNRDRFFERTLETYAKQHFPKEQFEIIVLDDKSTQNIKGLCHKYSEKYGLKFQYILFNRDGGAIRPNGWTPALSNNIGFKKARGSVIVISGPETLICEDAFQRSWGGANEGYCVYGNVFRSNLRFVGKIEQTDLSKLSFAEIESIEGAKHLDGCTKGWWWYYVAVRKEHLINIHGVDERFMLGMAGEDDDFARRMSYSGVPLKRDPQIVGIHQDHSAEDKKCQNHSFRFDKRKWKSLRSHNTKLLRDWLVKKDPVANKGIDWGSFEAIIDEETF